MFFYYLKQIISSYNGKKKVDNRGIITEVRPFAHLDYKQVEACYLSGNNYKDELGNVYNIVQVDGDEQVPVGTWRVFDPSRISLRIAEILEEQEISHEIEVIKKDYAPRTQPLYPHRDRRRFWKEYTYHVKVSFGPSEHTLRDKDLKEGNYPECLDYLHVTIHGGSRIFKVQGDKITLIETQINGRTVVGYDRNGEKIPNALMGWDF